MVQKMNLFWTKTAIIFVLRCCLKPWNTTTTITDNVIMLQDIFCLLNKMC